MAAADKAIIHHGISTNPSLGSSVTTIKTPVTLGYTSQNDGNIVTVVGGNSIRFNQAGKYLITYTVESEELSYPTNANESLTHGYIELTSFDGGIHGRHSGDIPRRDGVISSARAASFILSADDNDIIKLLVNYQHVDGSTNIKLVPLRTGFQILQLDDSWPTIAIERDGGDTALVKDGVWRGTDNWTHTVGAAVVDGSFYSFHPGFQNYIRVNRPGWYIISYNLSYKGSRQADGISTAQTRIVVNNLPSDQTPSIIPDSKVPAYVAGTGDRNDFSKINLGNASVVSLIYLDGANNRVSLQDRYVYHTGIQIPDLFRHYSDADGRYSYLQLVRVPDIYDKILLAEPSPRNHLTDVTILPISDNIIVDSAFSHAPGSSNIRVNRKGDYLFFHQHHGMPEPPGAAIDYIPVNHKLLFEVNYVVDSFPLSAEGALNRGSLWDEAEGKTVWGLSGGSSLGYGDFFSNDVLRLVNKTDVPDVDTDRIYDGFFLQGINLETLFENQYLVEEWYDTEVLITKELELPQKDYDTKILISKIIALPDKDYDTTILIKKEYIRGDDYDTKITIEKQIPLPVKDYDTKITIEKLIALPVRDYDTTILIEKLIPVDEDYDTKITIEKLIALQPKDYDTTILIQKLLSVPEDYDTTILIQKELDLSAVNYDTELTITKELDLTPVDYDTTILIEKELELPAVDYDTEITIDKEIPRLEVYDTTISIEKEVPIDEVYDTIILISKAGILSEVYDTEITIEKELDLTAVNYDTTILIQKLFPVDEDYDTEITIEKTVAGAVDYDTELTITKEIPRLEVYDTEILIDKSGVINILYDTEITIEKEIDLDRIDYDTEILIQKTFPVDEDYDTEITIDKEVPRLDVYDTEILIQKIFPVDEDYDTEITIDIDENYIIQIYDTEITILKESPVDEIYDTEIIITKPSETLYDTEITILPPLIISGLEEDVIREVPPPVFLNKRYSTIVNIDRVQLQVTGEVYFRPGYPERTRIIVGEKTASPTEEIILTQDIGILSSQLVGVVTDISSNLDQLSHGDVLMRINGEPIEFPDETGELIEVLVSLNESVTLGTELIKFNVVESDDTLLLTENFIFEVLEKINSIHDNYYELENAYYFVRFRDVFYDALLAAPDVDEETIAGYFAEFNIEYNEFLLEFANPIKTTILRKTGELLSTFSNNFLVSTYFPEEIDENLISTETPLMSLISINQAETYISDDEVIVVANGGQKPMAGIYRNKLADLTSQILDMPKDEVTAGQQAVDIKDSIYEDITETFNVVATQITKLGILLAYSLRSDYYRNQFIGLKANSIDEHDDIVNQYNDALSVTANLGETIEEFMADINSREHLSVIKTVGVYNDEDVLTYPVPQPPPIDPIDEETYEGPEAGEDLNYRENPTLDVPSPSDKLWWVKYMGFASLTGLAPVFWQTGFLAPTPTGVQPIPFPIIYAPNYVYTAPTGIHVIGTSQCGTVTAPFVYTINPNETPMGTLPPSSSGVTQSINGVSAPKNDVGTKASPTFNAEVGGYYTDTNPELTNEAPYIQDDFPVWERLSMDNLPQGLMLIEWCKQGKETQGMPGPYRFPV